MSSQSVRPGRFEQPPGPVKNGIFLRFSKSSYPNLRNFSPSRRSCCFPDISEVGSQLQIVHSRGEVCSTSSAMVVLSRTLRSAARTRSQTRRQYLRGGTFVQPGSSLGRIRAVDHGQNLAERDPGRRAGQAISSRCTAGADDHPRTFQLQEDLDQVTFGNDLSTRRSRESAPAARRHPAEPGPAKQDRHIPPSPRSSSGQLPPWPSEARNSKLAAIQGMQPALGLGLTRPTGPRVRPVRSPRAWCRASSQSRDTPDRATDCRERDWPR